jgi:hypothetical protein
MGRKKKPEPNDKEQSNRFMELARQIDTDLDKVSFEDTCAKILKAKKPVRQKKK